MTKLARLATDGDLDAAGHKLLAEALRQGEEARDTMEDALVSFGRWVLVNVFDDDAGAALGGGRDNPVWRALLARAGGPTLRLSRRLVYVSLQIAAFDRRITDAAWRDLEPGRKEMLLPLADESAMREAAQHVSAMKLSQRDTETYVAELRKSAGRPPAARMTVPRVTEKLKAFRRGFDGAAPRRRLERLLREASGDERAALKEELTAVREWAAAALRTLREKG